MIAVCEEKTKPFNHEYLNTMFPLMQVMMQTMRIFGKINAQVIAEATSEVTWLF